MMDRARQGSSALRWGSIRKRMVWSSTISTSLPYRAHIEALGKPTSGSVTRSKVNATSREVVGVPSCQNTSSRILNVSSVPSSESSHDSAK